MLERRNSGLKGYRKEGIQDWRGYRKKEFMTEEIQE